MMARPRRLVVSVATQGKKPYTQAFSDVPTFLAHMQTTEDQDAANLRWTNKDSYGIDIKVDEGQSRNREKKHRGEVVGYMVFGKME